MSFLRDIFGIGKKEEVEFNKINEWLEDYSKNEFIELKDNINDFYQKIEERIKDIETKVEELKNAEIGGKVSLREIQFMEGNRESYVKKVKIFLENIELPEKENYQEIIYFFNIFENDLNEFGKNTIKSYTILKEFFDKIMTDIARGIKEIEKSIENLVKNIEKSRIIEIEKMKKKIHAVKNAIKTKQEMINNIKEKKRLLKELEERKLKIEKDFEIFKSEKEYKNYQLQIIEKENIIDEIRKERDNILHLFSVLDKALKKYKRDSLDEKIIDLYLDNPNQAILEDENFEIIEILQKLEKVIEENKIELDEKKKEKTLQTIETINIDLLLDKRKRIKELTEKLKEKEKQIIKSPVILNYKDIEYKLEHIQNKIKDEENSILKLEQNKEKINEEKLKQELEKEINDVVRVKVKII